MTIPKKGSRRVCVEDVAYSWRIRKRPTYAQAAFESPMRLAIEACTEGPRSVLVVDLRVSRPDNWISPHQTSVTPALIRNMVVRAIALGWVPSGGPPFRMEYPLVRDKA